MQFDITAPYAAILALIMIALGAHVSMKRSELKVSILDGGDTQLAERIRRHGNFIEYVPVALILMILAEAAGTGAIYLHAAGILLVVGRILHPLGLHHDRPSAPLRIAGGLMTWISMFVCIGAIAVNFWKN